MLKVSEATLNGTSVQAAESSSRASVLRRLRTSDLVFHGLTRGAALFVLLLLSGLAQRREVDHNRVVVRLR